ncbi:hypothetical protein [Caldimonas tepidiphila]|nr:hypothetical protein [Caldimonas tepidiphila]
MLKKIGGTVLVLLVLAALAGESGSSTKCRWDRRAADFICR